MKVHGTEKNKEFKDPHSIAKEFEMQIKGAITGKFQVQEDRLSILFEDEQGVYFSEQGPGTLCSLVVGTENGNLYLVTAELDTMNQKLKTFKSEIIS